MPAINADFAVPDFANREELSAGWGYVQLATLATPGVGTTWEDGDIKQVITWRKARRWAADNLAFARDPVTRRAARLNANGYVPHDDVAVTAGEACHKYRFTFIGTSALRKTRLSDGQFIDFPHGVETVDTFDDNRLSKIHLPLFRKRFLDTWAEPNARGRWTFQDDVTGTVTGVSGALFFYSGETYSHAGLDALWTDIETKMLINEVDAVTAARFGDYAKWLTLRIYDLSEDAAAALSETLEDGNGLTLKKRKNWIDWRLIPGVVAADVNNPSKTVRYDQVDNMRQVVHSIRQVKTV